VCRRRFQSRLRELPQRGTPTAEATGARADLLPAQTFAAAAPHEAPRGRDACGARASPRLNASVSAEHPVQLDSGLSGANHTGQAARPKTPGRYAARLEAARR